MKYNNKFGLKLVIFELFVQLDINPSDRKEL